MTKRLTRGFTLIELMITVAIIAILASVAYPSYTAHVVKTRRSAAQSFMYTVASKQEQTILNARSYFAIATGAASEWTARNITVPTEVTSFYTFTVAADSAATPPAYVITATPKGAQLSGDTKCGVVTLDNTGVKTEAGTAASASECW